MSDKSLVEFDELKASITELVGPTLEIKVTDADSGQRATEALVIVKDFATRVEKVRKALVGPLNERVKFINDYAKGILAVLQKPEASLKAQLAAYEDELEKIRRAELARLEEERKRKEAELAARQEAERLAAAQAPVIEDEWFGAGSEPAEEVAQVEMKHAEERAVLQGQVAAQAWDIRTQRVSNARKVWQCEATDLAKVPREYLKIELNAEMVKSAARAAADRGEPLEIPGVRIWQETKIAVGRNTYVGHASRSKIPAGSEG